jgi:hypothetical protein
LAVDPKLRPLTLALRGFVLLVVLVLLGMLGWSERQKWIRSRVVSCTNHGHLIVMKMRVNLHFGSDWEIPHFAGAEGFKLLVGYCVAQYGTNIGALNCHHGATGQRRGGWQCVNLPKARWQELFARWEKGDTNGAGFHDGIPMYWCGGETGTGDRVVASVRLMNGETWFDYGRLKEKWLVERIAWLNRQLVELGEPPVGLNIPPNVDWPAVVKWAESVTNSFPKARQ